MIVTGLLEGAGVWDAQTLVDRTELGVPMGIECEITTIGLFPPADAHKQQASDNPDAEFPHIFLEESENYESIGIDGGAAAKEFARVLEAKYAIDLPHKFWRALRQGHVQCTALLTKVRRKASPNVEL